MALSIFVWGSVLHKHLKDAFYSYRLRWKRRRLLWRSWRKRRELIAVRKRSLPGSGVLVFSTMRNEMDRLPHWLKHYRSLGVVHFLIVDNKSDDGTAEYLSAQPDVSLWSTGDSYKASRFGVDWLTFLQRKFGSGRWCLTVDADEILIYSDYEKRPLPELVQWLDARGSQTFAAMMLDLYPQGPLGQSGSRPEADPIESLPYFDPWGYTWEHRPDRGIYSIRGGPRMRCFFQDTPHLAPHLHKIPLVKWRRSFVYLSSTHDLLPRRLNGAFDARRTDPTGVLLHTKFLDGVVEKSAEEKQRSEHFTHPIRYQGYYDQIIGGKSLWYSGSELFQGAEQLERFGLIRGGDWASNRR